MGGARTTSILGNRSVTMLLITCPRDGTARLQGTRSIIAHRTTSRGELTIVACRCGGHAILLQGVQRAHRGPDELPLVDDHPSPLTAVAAAGRVRADHVGTSRRTPSTGRAA